ncbi:MAG: hypothetical protein AAGD00_09375 [Planctomycetota bacterium]
MPEPELGDRSVLRAHDERLNEEIAGLNRVIEAMNDAGAERVQVLAQEAMLEVRRAAQRLLNTPVDNEVGLVGVGQGLGLASSISWFDEGIGRLARNEGGPVLLSRFDLAQLRKAAIELDAQAHTDPRRLRSALTSLRLLAHAERPSSQPVINLEKHPSTRYGGVVDRLTWLPTELAEPLKKAGKMYQFRVNWGRFPPPDERLPRALDLSILELASEIEAREAANPRGAGGIERFDPEPMRAAVTRLVELWAEQDDRVERAVEHTLTILEPIAERRRLPELREVTRLKRATYRLLVRTQAEVERDALAALPTLIENPDSIRTPAMVALVLRHQSAVEDLVTYIAVDEALAWCLNRGVEGRAAHDAIRRVVDLIEERDEDERAKGMALLRRFVGERSRLEGIRDAIASLDANALRLREPPSNLTRRLARSFDQLERAWLRWWGDLSESGTLEGEAVPGQGQITPLSRVEIFDRLMRALSARAEALATEPTLSVPEGAVRALSVLSGADHLQRALDFALEGQGVGVALALNDWERTSAALRALPTVSRPDDARGARFVRWLHELDHAWTREDRDRQEVREIVEYLNSLAR